MPMRKRTLRRMTPQARKLARLVGELESTATKLKNLVPAVQSLEMELNAEKKWRAAFGQPTVKEPENLFE